MRLMIATLILSVAAPAFAGGKNPGGCKSRCDSNYQFCVSRAVTKNAKKSCKADRKTCKSQCK
jgi:hypothetical protein